MDILKKQLEKERLTLVKDKKEVKMNNGTRAGDEYSLFFTCLGTNCGCQHKRRHCYSES
jgi:hypothetical protein